MLTVNPPAEHEWTAPLAGEYRFTWNYDTDSGRVLDLYQRAKTRQWNVATGLDWATDAQPDNPLGIPDELFVLHGTSGWTDAPPARRAEIRRHYTAWLLSQFLHGEQAALVCTARIVEGAPDLDAKFYAATQAMDEARHAEAYTRFLNEQVGLNYAMDDPLHRVVTDSLADGRWDLPILGMQVLVEGMGLAAFGAAKHLCGRSLPRAMFDGIVSDEARHVAFGRIALRRCYAELSTAELRDREDFVLTGANILQNRFDGRPVWTELGLDADACAATFQGSEFSRTFQRQLARHLIPTLRDIGLWTERVRIAMAMMFSRYQGRPAAPDESAIRAQESASRRAVDTLIHTEATHPA